MAERAREPALSDPCRPFDDEVLRHVDPIAGGELLEERAVEAARRAIVDVLDGRMMAQASISQPGLEPPVAPLGHLTVEEEREPFGVAQLDGLRGGLQLGEGACHAGKPELVELVEGGMGQHGWSPQW